MEGVQGLGPQNRTCSLTNTDILRSVHGFYMENPIHNSVLKIVIYEHPF